MAVWPRSTAIPTAHRESQEAGDQLGPWSGWALWGMQSSHPHCVVPPAWRQTAGDLASIFPSNEGPKLCSHGAGNKMRKHRSQEWDKKTSASLNWMTSQRQGFDVTVSASHLTHLSQHRWCRYHIQRQRETCRSGKREEVAWGQNH